MDQASHPSQTAFDRVESRSHMTLRPLPVDMNHIHKDKAVVAAVAVVVGDVHF